jgi:hypothetical protein
MAYISHFARHDVHCCKRLADTSLLLVVAKIRAGISA